MGGLNVKNTIVERVLQIVAPHLCSGCGKVGVVLCDDCKYDIIHEPFLGCIACGQPQRCGICALHHSSITRAFTVSIRTGALETLINRLKFEHTKAAARSLAELVHERLPLLPKDVWIVPIPTVRSHVRQRGYDQVELIARYLTEMREVTLKKSLRRLTNMTQHTVGRDARRKQAQQAFALADGENVSGKTVLLLDDIVTTGATLSAAAQTLADAGATVWAATLAYQPLD